MPQISINGETFDVFIVRNGEAEPIPMILDVASRVASATVRIESSTTSTLIVAENTDRRGLSLFNNSTDTLYLSYTNPATPTNAFMSMTPGAFLMLDQQLMMSTAIHGIWTGTDGGVQITEYS